MKKISTFLIAVFVSFIGSAAQGGPDSFGYTFIDSDEANGPLYNWIEIATPAGGNGNAHPTLSCDDCHEANIPLGFTFPFYGNNFTDITIGSNGTIYFEDVYLGLSNSCIPGTPSYTMAQYNFIAHLWDDLDPSSQGGIYTQAFDDFFVIEFYDIVPCCGAGDGDTWQIILFSNGNILMQYQELSNIGSGTDYTVGIQNDPTTGLEYLCNSTSPVTSGRSILWNYPGNDCNSASVDISSSPVCVGDTMMVTPPFAYNTWSDMSHDTTLIASAAVQYHVTTLFTDGCSASDTVTAGVNPSVTATASETTPCTGDTILVYGEGADSYTWNNSVNDSVDFLAVEGSTTYIVTGIDNASGCSDTASVVVDAFALTPVTYTETDSVLCSDESAVTLTEGTPSGGTFSGQGVTGNQFDPTIGVGNYEVVYTIVDGNNCSNSDMVTFVVENCLGVENNAFAYEIFPNPTDGKVQLKGLISGDIIQVYSLDGKLLIQTESSSNEHVVDISYFERGTYIIKVKDASIRIIKK